MLQSWIDAARDKESFRYTSLQPLLALPFQPPPPTSLSIDKLPLITAADAPRQRLVFVDGVLRPEMGLAQQLPLNLITGNAETGYALQLSAETCLALAPLEVVLISGVYAQPTTTHVALDVHLGRSARLTLIEHHITLGDGAPHAFSLHKNIHLAEHAKLVHARLQNFQPQHYHLSELNVQVAAHCFYHFIGLNTGAALMRHNVTITLQGDDAQTEVQSLQLLRGPQHADVNIHIQHNAPRTTSRQNIKTVAAERSKGVFAGKIGIAPHAQQSQGYQLSRGLMLSGQAEIVAKPELEIFADDVKCSHGSTIGQLDDTALFYLRSRGLPLAVARQLLVRAFVQEMVDTLPVDALRQHITTQLENWLGGLHG